MDEITARLTVYFQEPFWVGVFERIHNGRLSVCKVTFGAEPKDFEVYDFVLKNYHRLKFGPTVDAVVKKKSLNPKRMQRELRKKRIPFEIGSKSQQALQLLREEIVKAKKTTNKLRREAETQRRYAVRQQKRKDKHRGR